MLKFERATSLTEAVTERLRAEIVHGELGFGEFLSESRIAARYQVSRTPVREAFACLNIEGLVTTEPQQGTFVFTIDRKEYAILGEARAILETAALRLAVVRDRDRLIKHWTRLVDGMSGAVAKLDSKRYSQLDGEFHRSIFKSAANPYLVAANQPFGAKMEAVRNRLGAQPEHMAQSIDQHYRLLKLVSDGAIDEAADLLTVHICIKGEAFWAESDRLHAVASRGVRVAAMQHAGSLLRARREAPKREPESTKRVVGA